MNEFERIRNVAYIDTLFEIHFLSRQSDHFAYFCGYFVSTLVSQNIGRRFGNSCQDDLTKKVRYQDR